jgi:hypothetical protein
MIIPYAAVADHGFGALFSLYFAQWTPPMLGLAVLVIFGLASETRAACWRTVSSVGKLTGWVWLARERHTVIEIEIEAGHIY